MVFLSVHYRVCSGNYKISLSSLPVNLLSLFESLNCIFTTYSCYTYVGKLSWYSLTDFCYLFVHIPLITLHSTKHCTLDWVSAVQQESTTTLHLSVLYHQTNQTAPVYIRFKGSYKLCNPREQALIPSVIF